MGYFLSLLFLICGILCADEVESEMPNAIENLEGEPSVFVNGCVNVITGDFVECQIDMVLPGVEPFILKRCYHKTDEGKGSLGKSWNLNYDTHFDIKTEEINPVGTRATVEQFGGRLSFYTPKIYQEIQEIPLDPKSLKKSVTNTSSGRISGKTNIKNIKMVLRKSALKWIVRDGAGKVKHINNDFKIIREEHPAGNQVFYNYHKKMLSSVNFTNSQNRSIAAYFFEKNKNVLEVTGTDLRKVCYYFDHDRLVEVKRPDGPWEKYSYQKVTKKVREQKIHLNLITRKDKPGHRFLGIEYKNYHDQDPRLSHRVKTLLQPIGVDETPLVSHTFVYDLDNRTTHVKNALGHETVYCYDKNDRIDYIDKYTKEGNAYLRDKLYWSGHQLAARLVIPQACYTLAARTYDYDSYGNVTSEKLWGNLSGQGMIGPHISLEGKGQMNGCESYEKRSEYSQDGLNLLTFETDGTQSVTYEYAYDKLVAKYYWGNNQIYKREFFEYNSDLALTKHTVDNGTQTTSQNLTSVTKRFITNYAPRLVYPVGLPEYIEEKCLDIATGQERLIKKVYNQYNQHGRLIFQTHYDNNLQPAFTLGWEYDDNGNVVKEVNALGHVITREFDANNNLIKENGPHPEASCEYAYDFMNRLIKKVEKHAGQSFATEHRYDLVGNLIATVDSYGNETKFEYDEFQRLTKTTLPPVLNQYGILYSPIECKKYDELGNVSVSTDARGVSVSMRYTIRNQLCHKVFPDQTCETKLYNLNGTLRQAVHQDGTYTLYRYDFANHPVKQETYDREGRLIETTSALYDAFHLLSETDAAGHTTFYEYTPEGYLLRKRKGDEETTYTYDNLGRVHKTIQAYGDHSNEVIVGIKEYDLLNQVIEERTEDHAGNILTKTNYAYDINGNCTTVTEETAAGTSVTTTTFNSRNESTSLKDPENNQTVFSRNYHYRNEHGQNVLCLQATDSRGNLTLTIYDTHGRVAHVKRSNPFGLLLEQQETRYDAAGNLLAHINLNHNQYMTTLYEHDSMNHLTKMVEAWGMPQQRTTLIEYSSNGQKSFHIKPDQSKLCYSYNALGLLTAYNDGSETFAYQYEYDANHNLICVKDEKNQIETTKAYDQNNRLIQETLGNGLTLSYTYDRLSRPLTVTLPDQTVISYTYNASQLKAITYDGYTHEYLAYDQADNLLASKLIGNAGTLSRSYDRSQRCRETTHALWKETLDQFDSVGNLNQKTIKDKSGSLTSLFSYDDLNQLASEEGGCSHTYAYDGLGNCILKDGKTQAFNVFNLQLNDENYEYSYDGNGNLTARPDERMDYDALNRLIKHTNGSVETTYLYDAQNRRLSKSTYLNNVLTNTEKYFYIGQNEIGACNSSDKITQLRILNLNDGSEHGAAVAIKLANKLYAPIHDHTGSIASLIDPQNGQQIESYRYSAFGQNLFNHPLSPWLYAGKRFDEETGFVYFGHRYYDPMTARWTTTDPIGSRDGPNLYAYVHNNPLTSFDAFGLYDETGNLFFADLNRESFMSDQSSSFWGGNWSHSALDFCQDFGSNFCYGFSHPEISVPMMCRCLDDHYLEMAREFGFENNLSCSSQLAQNLGAVAFLGTTVAGAAKNVGKFVWNSAVKGAGYLYSRSFRQESVENLSIVEYSSLKTDIGVVKERVFSLDELSKAGQVMDRNGLTRAGRALDKHGGRPGSIFPKATGNPANKNMQGQYQLDDILTHPQGYSKPNKFGGIDYYRPNESGIRFYRDGTFRGFLEPNL